MTSEVGAATSPDILACCSSLYGHPLAELLVGESFHPGGLESTRKLLAAGGLRAGTRLLDVGCGLGASARLAATEFSFEVDAIDFSADVVARAESEAGSSNVRWASAEVAALPFEDGTFEAVLAECVLSTTDRPGAFAELRRVIRPGGVLLVSDVWVATEASPILAANPVLGATLCVTGAWRPGELESIAPASGFAVDRKHDLSAAILELVDRVEGRLAFAAIAMRDLRKRPAGSLGAISISGLGDFRIEGAGPLADQIRAAVARGDLGYFSAVLRRVTPAA